MCISHVIVGRRLLEQGKPSDALVHFAAARRYPENLGEGKHLLTSEADLDYFSGVAAEQMGDMKSASAFWRRAADAGRDTSSMSYYKALSLARLGETSRAASLLAEMRRNATAQLQSEPKIDYFATSLPNLILFKDDLEKRNRVDALFQLALADLGEEKRMDAAEKLRSVLELDCNHLAAQAELSRMDAILRPQAGGETFEQARRRTE